MSLTTSYHNRYWVLHHTYRFLIIHVQHETIMTSMLVLCYVPKFVHLSVCPPVYTVELQPKYITTSCQMTHTVTPEHVFFRSTTIVLFLTAVSMRI